MVITGRVRLLRSAVEFADRGFDPECAITLRLERLAMGLAMLAGLFSPALLPGLPPRRSRALTVLARSAEASTPPVPADDRVVSRTA
jgi:hypothetical protein